MSRLAFAGTPDLAALVLNKLLQQGNLSVTHILTQPDRPAGRGRKLKAGPVKELGLLHSIPIEQAINSSELDPNDQLSQTDIMVVAAYGMILPEEILNRPKHGSINIHTSLLPRWRGAAPIQRAIEAGDSETGISIMQMDAGLDTGPILLQKSCSIDDDETAGSLHDKLALLGADAVIEILDILDKAKLNPQSQDNSKATYAKKIHKTEAKLDWNKTAAELQRKIRAFNPDPVCYSRLNDQDMRIWEADHKISNHGHSPGTVLDCSNDAIEVACLEDSLLLRKIQIPGKKAIHVHEFLNGRPDFKATMTS